MSLPCPKCGEPTKVLDSRPTTLEAAPSIRRRRCCTNAKCRHRITTLEINATQLGLLRKFPRMAGGLRDALRAALNAVDNTMAQTREDLDTGP